MVALAMGVEAPEPNRVLAGRYKLELRLGAGGMGTIWRAEHLVLQAPVAVKLIDRDAIPDEDTLTRFLREAKAAAALRSPHVVQIIDYGIDGKTPFMVMELLEGENLAQRLKRSRRLSRQETARILTHVGRAMQRAHDAGIVHRDLKPDNVFLVKNEDEEHAKVLDFGVAKVERAALEGPEGTRTRTGSILGTPYYMSPEQAQGNKAVDHRTDLWALGVIAFECLTGKRPFYSDGLGDLVLTICVRDLPVPSDVAPVPLGFDAWFARACARDPEQRFQSAREMTDALREALGLEVREVGRSTPDVVVASAQFPSGAPPSEVPTIARESISSSGARSRTRPDGDAATVIAPPSGADAGIPAPTEALFGTTQHEPPPRETKSGLGIVFLVAGAALVAGLIGGLMFLNRPVRNQETMILPAPAAPPASSEELAKEPPKRDATRDPEATPSASAALSPSASAPAPAAPAAPAAVDPGAQSAGVHEEPEPAEPPAEAETPDGGWTKPEWAMPDNEIPVNRGPDGEDRRIVIPEEPAPPAN
jgi:eukaryotic-like serine/threonine-protein kinase